MHMIRHAGDGKDLLVPIRKDSADVLFQFVPEILMDQCCAVLHGEDDVKNDFAICVWHRLQKFIGLHSDAIVKSRENFVKNTLLV